MSFRGPVGRGPQVGPQSCVGKESDGSRSHRCHRRCGHRGQLPAAPARRGSCLWTSPWMTRCTSERGCGRTTVVTNPTCPCTGRAQACPHAAVGERRPDLRGCGRRPAATMRGEGRRTPWCGRHAGVVGPGCGRPGRRWRKMGTREYPQEFPQAGDMWTTDLRTRSGGGVTIRSRRHAQLGRTLWTTVDGVVARCGRRSSRAVLQGAKGGGQPACCLIRLVSSVTWL